MSESERPSAAASTTRTYRAPFSRTWWLRRPSYILYIARDLSPGPVLLWLLILLFEVRRLDAGAGGYHRDASIWFVVFSVVCLAFSLLHSITWLSLSGVVLRVRLGPRTARPATVASVLYLLWFAASAVVGFLLVWLSR